MSILKELEKKLTEAQIQVAEVPTLKNQIAEMYSYVHSNLDPVLELVNEIADTKEGKALLDKAIEKRMAKIERE